MAKSRRPADDDEDDDDAPRRKRRDDDEDEDDGPIKPRKKRKSAAGPTKIVLRITGCVIGAIGLFILLYWVYSPVGTDSSMVCYFPKETSRLTGYDVDDMVKIVKAKDINDTVMNNYKAANGTRWKDDAGVTHYDVLKYLGGQVTGDPDEEKDLAPQDKRGHLTVIRFRKSVDEAAFVASFNAGYLCEERDEKGKKYYQLWWKRRVPPDNHEEREDDVSFFFPNKTTLVYATTRRELTEAMNKTPGRISLEGSMRTLADEVDGHYFTCSGGWFEERGVSNSMAFGLGFVDEDLRDSRKTEGVVGTASWFASNGNDFLYASANLYGSKQAASSVRRKLEAGYRKAQEDIYQSESGKPGGLTDPFNPPQPKAGPGAAGGFAGAGGASSEQTKDIVEALSEYAKTARVRQRGKLVIVEGLIPHGTPEQGVFEKLWKAIGTKFQVNQGGMGGMGPMGGMQPGGGMGMPGGGPAGAPIGPPR